MMITFQGLLKQKSPQVLFENALPASDPGTLEQLKELSSRRRAIESINQNSFVTEATAREMSGGLTSRCEQNIQKVEQYLPLLGNLIHHVNIVGDNPKMVRWISELKIRFSTICLCSQKSCRSLPACSSGCPSVFTACVGIRKATRSSNQCFCCNRPCLFS